MAATAFADPCGTVADPPRRAVDAAADHGSARGRGSCSAAASAPLAQGVDQVNGADALDLGQQVIVDDVLAGDRADVEARRDVGADVVPAPPDLRVQPAVERRELVVEAARAPRRLDAAPRRLSVAATRQRGAPRRATPPVPAGVRPPVASREIRR
ncbi:MAG: hypothetical protein IPH80_20600 [Myxococcales bacterium]|nr:hypothetical protein [Myxococcales bacterium]